MSEIGPPYQVREEPSFRDDCRLIHPDPQAFDELFAAIQFVLERAPYLLARPVDPDNHIWVRRFNSFVTDSGVEMPAVRVSYQVVREPPNGLVSLRHVRTPEDVQAGMHDEEDEA